MSSPSPAPRAAGLLTVYMHPSDGPHFGATFVGELDRATIWRIRQDALTMRAREQRPIIIELRYVAQPGADALIATLDDLRRHEVRVIMHPLGNGRWHRTAPATAEREVAPPPGAPSPSAPSPSMTASPARAEVSSSGAEIAPTARPHAAVARPVADADPFGLDRELRARVVRPLRFLFERYWRVEVSGIEHVPRDAALIASNHSGAVPFDAVMLAVALDLCHPAQRCLRVLYDKFVDALPFVGPLYNRLGGVSASLANAELLLRRGELVGLFPEGIAGVEKRWTQRYQLQPFKTGTARLSVRTGSPIVPVAIVGAEEAYPVVARLYRAGRVVGLPWIPVTPLFPHLGLLGALPLPSKWHIRFCEPIAPPALNGRAEDDVVADLTARLRAAVASALADLLAKRRSVFV
jgi:1-acyl-sn-glycerol-3-phosphate acyltransferase